jgi:diadenosine tetraphosphate (Ap4A) HIT family hydrolase
VLLAPKLHVTTYKELPAELVPEFALTAQRLEVAVETGLAVPGSMVLVNNVVSQSVPHLHLHVIPRRPKDGLRFWLGPGTRIPTTIHRRGTRGASEPSWTASRSEGRRCPKWTAGPGRAPVGLGYSRN